MQKLLTFFAGKLCLHSVIYHLIRSMKSFVMFRGELGVLKSDIEFGILIRESM